MFLNLRAAWAALFICTYIVYISTTHTTEVMANLNFPVDFFSFNLN